MQFLTDPADRENYHDASVIIVDANNIAARGDIDNYDHEEQYVEYLANDRDAISDVDCEESSNADYDGRVPARAGDRLPRGR
eukprot:2868317-Heterocapsa_arctica.AAC.1